MSLGTEFERFDARLPASIVPSDRRAIWASASRILDQHRDGESVAALALGYVQSGKTTSMSALCALAADRGYELVIALLGTTILLLEQNRQRLEGALGLEEHLYRWARPMGTAVRAGEINSSLERGRIMMLPVLKNATRLRSLVKMLNQVANRENLRTLIIDDEADQASLNTRPQEDSPSSIYAALSELREALPNHLYVQYTATPYAPLLLEPSDPLMPSHVEFLKPGTGYTGGREFLVEQAKSVVRVLPDSADRPSKLLARLPGQLVTALGAFYAGAAHLTLTGAAEPPITMLVHSTHLTDLQRRYHFLIDELLADARKAEPSAGPLGEAIESELHRLYDLGLARVDEAAFWATVRHQLRETTLWLVNSTSDVRKIAWQFTPLHILVGGNKLDRGFTVEGLTVTFMNRKPSDQIDTLEQRARAFGYRGELLPYCQLFASARTVRLLSGTVHTEDDLRANLKDWLDQGGSVSGWAAEVGLDLPVDARPTRETVVVALRSFNADGDWHALRRPDTAPGAIEHNANLVRDSGLLAADWRPYGRLSFRCMRISIARLYAMFLEPWMLERSSPSWLHGEILEQVLRHPRPDELAPVVLMASAESTDELLLPRMRRWEDDTGFVNLFQGRDNAGGSGPRYEGDRTVGLDLRPNDGVVLQVHYVQPRDSDSQPLFTLAVHLGDRQLVRRLGSE